MSSRCSRMIAARRAREREIEPPASRPRSTFAMLPPKFGGHGGYSCRRYITVWKAVSSSLCLNGLAKLFSSIRAWRRSRFGDVLAGSHIHKPSLSGLGSIRTPISVDIPDKILIYGSERAPPRLATKVNEALPHATVGRGPRGLGLVEGGVDAGRESVTTSRSLAASRPSMMSSLIRFIKRGALARGPRWDRSPSGGMALKSLIFGPRPAPQINTHFSRYHTRPFTDNVRSKRG